MAQRNMGRNQETRVGDNVSNLQGAVNSFIEKVHKVSPSPSREICCIYRVHGKFRKINEFAYTPDTVAIGPFHRGKENLQLMEDHKLRYVFGLLNRTTTTKTMQETKFLEIFQAIRRLEERSRKCYSEPIELSSDEFVEMMVVDGLFIIELFRKYREITEIDRDDPIFNTVCGLSSILRDLILLENQLPMFVLQSLFDQTKVPNQGGLSLKAIALVFFKSLMPVREQVFSNYEGKHLLDLLANVIYPTAPLPKWNQNQPSNFLPSVTELRQAGIKCEVESATDSFLNIRFQNGVLKIPQIPIHDQTDSILRNLIALEQYSDGETTSYITCYAFLMDSLINSAKDVKILRDKTIISNYLSDHEAVASLFNKLCNEVSLVNFCYPELCKDVDKYYKSHKNVWFAALWNEHFRNPWTTISIIAAIVLLFLTGIQAVFSVLSYIKDNGGCQGANCPSN